MSEDIIKSYLGYLRDCAMSTLRRSGLDNIFKDKNAIVIDLPAEALDTLSEGEYSDNRQEMWDAVIRLELSGEEEQLFLGLLFFVGRLKGNKAGRSSALCAPLLTTRLRAIRLPEEQAVLIETAEDDFSLNLDLLAKLVDAQDEEELNLRFKDVFEVVPGWPVEPRDIEQLLGTLRKNFPEMPGLHTEQIMLEGFQDVPLQEAMREARELQIIPTQAVFIHQPTPEMTVVRELSALAEMEGAGESVLAELIHMPGKSRAGENWEIEQQRDMPGFRQEPEAFLHPLIPLELSEAQRKVLASARQSRLTVVSGPPGTGKSYTISALILDSIIRGETVLMASRSAKAVSVVVEMMKKIGGEFIVGVSGDREQQRKLADQIDLLTDASSPMLLMESSELERLEHRHEQLQKEMAQLAETIQLQLYNTGEWGHHFDKAEEVEEIAEATVHVRRLSEYDELCCRRWFNRGKTILQEGQTRWLRRWRGRKYIQNLCSVLRADVHSSADELDAGIEWLSHQRKMEEVYREILKHPALSDCWRHLEEIRQEMIEVSKQVLEKRRQKNLDLLLWNRDNRQMLRLFRQALRSRQTRRKRALLESVDKHLLLEAFPCWACTTPHVSHILPLERRLFDLVVIDEASQCDMASAAPVLYRSKRAVIVGDKMQLNAVIFISKQQEMAGFTRNDVPEILQGTHRYSQNSLYDIASDQVAHQHFHMLDEHFRSRPPIIEFSNKKFYNNRLRIMTERPTDRTDACIFLHTVDGMREEGSTVNAKEVDKVLELVSEFSENDRHAETLPLSIGIVTPFRDHAEAIKRALAAKFYPDILQRHQIIATDGTAGVGTAHALQGDERDIVILSLSLDADYHHNTLRFIQTEQLFNVAITRAREQIHIVSSVRPEQLPDGLLKEYLLYAIKSELPQSSSDRFDSEFEREVCETLRQKDITVYTQFPACGFKIDLVAVKDDVCLGVECDGPTHFNAQGEYTEKDVWRHTILRRAGWTLVHIPYISWRKNPEACISTIIQALSLTRQTLNEVRE